MAYRAKRIMRRSSLYPSTKFYSTGGTSKVGFIESTSQSSSRKRQSVASLSSDYNDSIGCSMDLIDMIKLTKILSLKYIYHANYLYIDSQISEV